MACTTILVGKKASYDGSTIIARNDDSGAGHFTPKKFVVVHPEEQPRKYGRARCTGRALYGEDRRKSYRCNRDRSWTGQCICQTLYGSCIHS